MIGFLMRLRARAARRMPGRGTGPADRGSLAMAMLVGIMGSGIAAVLIPMAVVQIGSTTFDNSRTREMNAAEAGLSVGVGLIRSSVDSNGAGDTADLPCTASALTGTVDATSGSPTYRVRIGYYVADPANQPDSWLATYTGPLGAGHGMLCVPGHGTSLPAGAPDAGGIARQVPSWAVITATGADARGERTLRAIYTVKTTNANVTGGSIFLWTKGATQYCMDAGTAPAAGVTTVVVQPCQVDPLTSKPIAQQTWAYNTDLSIQLVSSVKTNPPNGLCLSGGTVTAGQNVMLAACSPIGQAPWNQVWGVNDSGHFQGITNVSPTSKATLGNQPCIAAGVAPTLPSAGTKLTLQNCTGSTTDVNQTWVPSPDAGSGMAFLAGQGGDSSPIQYVNFQSFSECIDATNHTTAKVDGNGNPGGGTFLIGYTCKQSPNPSDVAWNQKFAYVGGQLVTNDGTGNYCVTSPASTYSSASTGPWVNVTKCPATPTASTTWWKFDANGNPEPSDPAGPLPGGVTPNSALKYLIMNGAGACLSMTTDSAAAYNGYPKIITVPCGAAAGQTLVDQGPKLQMWNATANVQSPGLTNFGEVDEPVAP